MENILTLNQSIFGTKSKERRMSRRSRRALVQELYTPTDADEITYDEGYDIDGGGTFSIVMRIGGLATGISSGIATQLLCGFISGKIPKLTSIGGPWMFLIGFAIGCVLSAGLYNFIFSRINDSQVTLFSASNWFLPNLTIDLSDCVSKLFGRVCIKSLTSVSAWAIGNAFGLAS